MQVGKPVLVRQLSGCFNQHNLDWLDSVSRESGTVCNADGYETLLTRGIFCALRFCFWSKNHAGGINLNVYERESMHLASDAGVKGFRLHGRR
jgi:hypothetical protein